MVVNYVCVKVCLSVIYPGALIELAMGFELGVLVIQKSQSSDFSRIFF